MQEITKNEVAKHNTEKDLWIILRGNVYDLTAFDHPGGAEELAPYKGKDASAAFSEAGHGSSELRQLEEYKIGTLELTQEPDETKPEVVTETGNNKIYSRSLIGSGFFIISISLLIGGIGWNWWFHDEYRDGLRLEKNKIDENGNKEPLYNQEAFFNYHVVLMMFGYLLPNAIAAGTFRFMTFLKREQAMYVHASLNTIGLICSWVGFAMAHYYQKEKWGIKFWQPHTYVGMLTLVLYTFEWLLGAAYGLLRARKVLTASYRAVMLPVHRALGSLCYVLISISVLLGLFSNYGYDLKYEDDDELAATKRDLMNWMITLLTIGICLVYYYITDTQFSRKSISKIKPTTEDNIEMKAEKTL